MVTGATCGAILPIINGDYDKEKLKVYFKSPNQGFMARLSGHALTALSVAAIAVKDLVSRPFRPSPVRIEQQKSKFVSDFLTATQGVIDAAPAFQKAAQAKGFKFDLDVDQVAKLSTRFIELATKQDEKYGRSLPEDQRLLAPAKDLGKAMKDLAGYLTLDEKDVSLVNTATQNFVGALKRRIDSIESSHGMRDAVRASLDVTIFQLTR